MLSFCFKQIPQIIFGPAKRSKIVEKALEFGPETILITGGRSFTESDHFEQLKHSTRSLGMTLHLEHITAEPSPQIIDDIADKYRKSPINSVIAIGGGSALDAGKAISAMLREDGPVTDFLEGVGSRQPSGKKLPFIAVPTTSGTGSETTSNAVLSEVGREGFKKSLRHDNYIPNIAIIDPELTISCPPSLTATCGMDCFTQLVEAYLSINSSPLTDTFSLQGVQAISRSLLLSFQQGDNIEARSDLSYAAMLSGVVLANAGLGTIHGFASAIGGAIPVAHGTVCGTLMEPVNRLTLARLRQQNLKHPALKKYAQLGEIFTDKKQKTDIWYQDHFIHILAELSENMHIPDLKSYDISEEKMKIIIAETSNKYNPVQFDSKDLEKIIKSKC